MTFRSKTWFHVVNGKKGGRRKQDEQIYIKIPNITLVNLTSQQYEVLIKRYGNEIITKAISILDDWLRSGSSSAEKYIGKNNYSHFRKDGWVINEAMKFYTNITKN